MDSFVTVFLVLLSPLIIAAGGLWAIRRHEGEHRRKSPVSGKVCRYPGYTLSKEIEKLDDRLNTDLLMLFMIPAVTLALSSAGLLKLSGNAGWTIFGISYAGAIGFFVSRLFRTSRDLRMKRLGLDGERIVGHQLAELYRAGFFVFHDFPLDFGNIDHVAVGPPGVFAIETKFKRKTKGENEAYKMTFDQNIIRFPEGETTKPLEQATRQAGELRKRLDAIFGELPVEPVIVYPGWWVTREAAKVPVPVMNDKQLLGWLSKEKRVLDEETVRRVAAFLDEKCRDVSV